LNYTLSSVKNDTDGINFRASDAIIMQMNGDHLQMTGHITLMEFIVIIHSKEQQLLSWFVAKRTTINIPLGFGTTDLNGDGASFSDAYQGIVTVFQEKAETMIVCHGVLL
jgi:hypothetical protein